MAETDKQDDTPIQIAKITSRWQIATAMIGVGAGIVIAVLGNDAFFAKGGTQAACNVIEVAGSYGENDGWEFEMDLLTGQFESENQAGPGRIDGTVTAVCDAGRVAARIEGQRDGAGAPVLCLFDGARSGAEGRAITGRFLCDDTSPGDNLRNYWRGDLRLTSDV